MAEFPQPVPGAAAGTADGMVRVTLKEGQSLRDLARQHLGNPNLWTEILKASGLAPVPVFKVWRRETMDLPS